MQTYLSALRNMAQSNAHRSQARAASLGRVVLKGQTPITRSKTRTTSPELAPATFAKTQARKDAATRKASIGATTPRTPLLTARSRSRSVRSSEILHLHDLEQRADKVKTNPDSRQQRTRLRQIATRDIQSNILGKRQRRET